MDGKTDCSVKEESRYDEELLSDQKQDQATVFKAELLQLGPLAKVFHFQMSWHHWHCLVPNPGTAWPWQTGFLKFFLLVWGVKTHTGCLGCQRISLSVVYTNAPCILISLHNSAGGQSVTARSWQELSKAHSYHPWTCCFSKLGQPCLWFYRKDKQEPRSVTFPPGFPCHRVYYRAHSPQQIVCHTHSSLQTAFRKIFREVGNGTKTDSASFLGNSSPKTFQRIFK